MAITTPFFFFLRRSLTIKTRPPRSFFNGGTTKPYSSSQSSLLPTPTDHPKTSLSARMSFVFDQIDAIEKDRSGKDEALQRIRAWKEKKKTQEMKSRELGFQNAAAEAVDSNRGETEENKKENLFKNEVEVVHPWPEWIELMERLVHQNYFDLRKKDNDQTVVDVSGLTDEGFDFTRDWLTVRTACLNFGRDRFDILRSLSRKDIQILVGHGCPSVDAKAVFSAKLLRKHVHLDEGDVCSSCSRRNSCDRAFILTLKEDEARTLDIMRILLTFGFDPIIGSVENKPLMKMKSVKTVVRKLLHEVVKLSAVPIDPNLPPPVFKKPPPKVKQPPPQPKKRVGRDDIEMKKGDWLCPKCDFMNFAKNTVCLQCDAKRPKRQLLPGEWECPECNFLNYRRNMSCFHCEHKRPPDEFMDNQLEEKPHGPRTRLERVARMPSVSNAWNFDFDDNESDGADVAAFEFADPPKIGRDSSLDGRDNSGDSRGFEHDSFETSRMERIYERGRHSEPDQRKPTGFSDFDDEDDDIDSYELDLPNNNSTEAFSSTNVPGFSESNDSDDLDHYSNSRQRGNSRSYDKPSQLMRGKLAFADSEEDEKDFDSDKELSVHPNWKSSHIADSRPGIRNRSRSGPYKGISFGSDDELDLDSDDDDEEDIDDQHFGSNRRGMRRRSSDSEDGLSYGKDSDDDSNIQSHGYKMRGNKGAPDRRGNSFRGRDQFASARGARHRSNDMMSDRKNSFGNGNNDRRGNTFRGHDQFASAGGAQRRSNDMMSDRKNSFGNVDRDRSFRGSGRNDRESKEGGYGGRRSSGRVGNLHDFDRPARGEGFRDNRRGRSSELSDRSERGGDFGGDRPRRRIIER